MDDLQLTPIEELEGYKLDTDINLYNFSKDHVTNEKLDFNSIKDRIERVFKSFSHEIDNQREIFDNVLNKATLEIKNIKESRANIERDIEDLRVKCLNITNEIDTTEGLLNQWNLCQEKTGNSSEGFKSLVQDLEKNQSLLNTKYDEAIKELENASKEVPRNDKLHALESALGIEVSCRDGCIILKFSQTGARDSYFGFKIEDNRYVGVLCEPSISDFCSIIDSLNKGMTFSQVCFKLLKRWYP